MKDGLGEDEANKLTGKRFQIINGWRPVGSSPIVNMPLTICDYKSLNLKNDVHSSAILGSLVTGSLYMISHNEQDLQNWYYMSPMTSNELFVFKIFDSNPNVAQFGAHTAFTNDDTPLTDLEQRSIELRCLIIYD